MKAPWVMAVVAVVFSSCEQPAVSEEPVMEQSAELDAQAPTKGILGPRIRRTDLATNQTTDSALINAWGLAFNPAGLAWIAANGNGSIEISDANGRRMAPPLMLPPAVGQMGPAKPTGLVFNDDLSSFTGDALITVTENGTIAGWQPSAGRGFETRMDNSGHGAIYKGVARGSWQGARRLYAADFHNGTIDVFDSAYVALHTQGDFKDPQLPGGYGPFNITAVNDGLVVTYARQDRDRQDETQGKQLGIVDLFDGDGHLLQRLTSRGVLNAPWAVAVTPYTWGALGNRLLIGNFGDGRINMFRLELDGSSPAATFEGALSDASGKPIRIEGLWGLAFGPGSGGADGRALYFTAGPREESRGVFGKLELETPRTLP